MLIYNTSDNRWDRGFSSWPPGMPTPLYLTSGGGLSFTAPAASAPPYDEYVSDPGKPVPYMPRPTRFSDTDAWRRWLVTDQRFVVDRPDVLSYVTAPLATPVRVSGAPAVHLVASTSGTDADWVVKLIDVYPDDVPSQPEMGGYELPIATFRYASSNTASAIVDSLGVVHAIAPGSAVISASASDEDACFREQRRTAPELAGGVISRVNLLDVDLILRKRFD